MITPAPSPSGGDSGAQAGRSPGPITTAVVVFGIAVLIAATLWGSWGESRAAGLLGLDLAAGIVGCAFLPLLLRAPVLGAVPLAVLAAFSPAATPPSTFGTLEVARRRPIGPAAAIAVVGVAAHGMRGLWRPVEGLPFGWWLVLVVVTHGALLGWGALTRARRALIASLQERADRAETEQGRRVAEARAAERAQMAREMHDVLAHRLSLLATYAGALEYRPDAPPEQLSRAAGIVRVGVHQALEDLRKVITVLRDEDVGARGPEGLQPNLSDLSDLVEEARAAGTVVRFDDGMQFPAAAPPLIGRTAYRVVQEGLTNARKHAPGQPVHVRVAGHPDAGLEIEICNPLASQATAAAPLPGSGTGLVGLTERVHLAGGRLDHQRRSGNFRLLAWLPWPA